jgi:diguanylate cyclase (GGDEF)-like protein
VSLSFNLDILGLPFQLAITILVTTLLFALTQSIRRKFLDYWTLSWASLALGLGTLLVRHHLGLELDNPLGYLLCVLYCFSGYLYMYLVICGCQHWSVGQPMSRRQSWFLLPTAVLAGLLPWAVGQMSGGGQAVAKDVFARLLGVQSVILAVGYFIAWISLRGSRKYRQRKEAGSRVLSLALFAQMLYCAHLLPLIVLAGMIGSQGFMDYLHYAIVYDMVLKILLAFGMVIVGMDSVRQELEAINANLTAATERLQHIASKDHLTEALNRHAFYSILEHNRRQRNEPISGCVVVLDIDDLKPINDRFGHAAGDYTIRTVAKTIRSVIRADDLLFRWGGDEFLVILPHVEDTEARNRFDRLKGSLQGVKLNGVPDPVDIRVSAGIVPFKDLTQLEQAIADADEAMYAQKVQSKTRFLTPVGLPR